MEISRYQLSLREKILILKKRINEFELDKFQYEGSSDRAHKALQDITYLIEEVKDQIKVDNL